MLILQERLRLREIEILKGEIKKILIERRNISISKYNMY